MAALHQLLGHAGRVLAGLASTEEDIAYILTKLASKDGSDLAEQRRHLADEALADAQRARDRARALRRLAETGAAQARAPEGGRAGIGGNRKGQLGEAGGGPEERDREAEDRDEAASARDLAAETRDQESATRDVASRTRDKPRSFVTM